MYTPGSRHARGICQRLPFSEVNSPGTYVANESGSLFRVPAEALGPDKHTCIELVSNGRWLVTKISDDPWISVSAAREVAAEADLYVNF